VCVFLECLYCALPLWSGCTRGLCAPGLLQHFSTEHFWRNRIFLTSDFQLNQYT